MSYLGPDQEDCVNVTRYVFPEQALPAIGRFLTELEQRWQDIPALYVVEVMDLPQLPTEEEFEAMVKDDTEIM